MKFNSFDGHQLDLNVFSPSVAPHKKSQNESPCQISNQICQIPFVLNQFLHLSLQPNTSETLMALEALLTQVSWGPACDFSIRVGGKKSHQEKK